MSHVGYAYLTVGFNGKSVKAITMFRGENV